MNPRQYTTARAAGARFARLYTQLPGSVRAIDYSKLHMPASSDPERHQEVALECLDEYHDLRQAFLLALEVVGQAEFRAWFLVRVMGYAVRETDYPERTAYRVLRRVDAAVDEALIERDILKGYGERDLLEAGGRCARDVVVWINEEAFA